MMIDTLFRRTRDLVTSRTTLPQSATSRNLSSQSATSLTSFLQSQTLQTEGNISFVDPPPPYPSRFPSSHPEET